MSSEIKCLGCGADLHWQGEIEFKCPFCDSIVSEIQTLLEKDVSARLDVVAGYRRVGRFDDAQQELDNILESNEDLPFALFGCFLNAYEVTEYAFDKINGVKICKCNSTSNRSVADNKDWQDAKKYMRGELLEQWIALSDKIEELRKENRRIKNNLPKYRAILICDYTNEKDRNATRSIYDILSKQTDVFFPLVTLENIKSDEEKEKYLIQVIKNPEIAPLMFVIYSDAFNYRNKGKKFFYNFAGQCRAFSKVHTKGELFSVTCDCEPSPMIKAMSIKTIRCKDFDDKYYNNIAKKILENILLNYKDDEYEKFANGEIVKLNENRGLSPKVLPLEEN